MAAELSEDEFSSSSSKSVQVSCLATTEDGGIVPPGAGDFQPGAGDFLPEAAGAVDAGLGDEPAQKRLRPDTIYRAERVRLGKLYPAMKNQFDVQVARVAELETME